MGRLTGDPEMTVVATIEQLEAIYGFPNDASTVKVADRITPSYRALMDQSPFVVLGTCGPEGLDCSPRGDLPGFVRIHDEKTLMMPDRRGNNRCASTVARMFPSSRSCWRRSRWTARRRAP